MTRTAPLDVRVGDTIVLDGRHRVVAAIDVDSRNRVFVTVKGRRHKVRLAADVEVLAPRLPAATPTEPVPLDDEVETWVLDEHPGPTDWVSGDDLPDVPARGDALLEVLKAWTDERDFVVLRQSEWEVIQGLLLDHGLAEYCTGIKVVPVEL